MTVYLSPVGGAGAQFFDNNGNPLSGGKIYTYVAGTTTPATTYSTSAGNIANANPIILDAAGRISGSSEIWLTKNVAYKFIITTSADVLLATWDNVSGINDVNDTSTSILYTAPYANAVPVTVNSKLAQVLSVKDFGAVGNGVVDDTLAIQTAINSAAYIISGFYGEATGKSIFFPAGVYRLTAAINIPVNAGVSLVGEGKTKSTVWQSVPNANVFNVTGNNFRGEFYGMRLTGVIGQVTGPSKGINIGPNGNQIFVQNCWINNLGYGIYGNPTSDSNFINNTFEFCHTPVFLGSGGNGYITISDNVFYNCGPGGAGSGEQRASFDFQGTTQTIFTDNRFVSDTPQSPQSGGYILVNNAVDFIFSNNVMGVNSLSAANIVITSSNKVRIVNNTFPEAFKEQMIINGCTDIVVSGNRLTSMKNIGLFGKNLVDVINTKKLRFTDNYLGDATNYVLYIRTTCEDIVVANNNFDGGAFTPIFRTFLMQGVNQAVITGNTFRNGVSGQDFTCDTCTEVVFSNNTLDRGFVIDPNVAPNSIYGNLGGTVRTYRNAPPAVGTWTQGDVIWFTQPTIGSYSGAVCITSGTPGTWRLFGQLGAISSIAATPSQVGEIAVVGIDAYIAVGTTNAADWKKITP